MAGSIPTLTAPHPTPAEVDAKLADRWGWFMALGALFVVLGTIGLAMVGLLSVVSVVYIAALLAVGGIFQLVHAFRCKGWRGTASHVAGGALYVVAAVLLLAQPIIGLVTITFLIGAVIFATGITRLVIAFQHRPEEGWLWLAVSGAVGVLLALLILAGLPGNAIWVLGLLVAIEIIMEGWSMILMGTALRRWKRAGAAAAT
jgi:uncharacterized membrane protein HdeD (DUF308 family)